MMIYKILRAEEWRELQDKGATKGAPIDVADGFIHFSTAAQAAETAGKYFANIDGLMLVAYRPEDFGVDLKWEVSRGGDKFPHLYADLPLAPAVWAKPLPCEGDGHLFPEGMT